MSIELLAEIPQILEGDIVRRPSFFQLKYFILGKEPTIQAKLWCCIRNLRTRQENMDAMRMEMDEVQDNRELLQIKIDRLSLGTNVDSSMDAREKEVMVRKYQRQMKSLDNSVKNLHQTLKETEEEAAFLVRAFRALEKKEKLKPLDDVEAQTEYWNEKYSQKLDLMMLLHKPIDTELVHDILLLDDKTPVKKKMISLLEGIQKRHLQSIQLKQESHECLIESQA